MRPDTDWLFLPPEVEALVPILFSELTASGPSPVDLGSEQERVETLVLTGDADAWRAYLRSCVARLEDSTPSGQTRPSHETLLAILKDQFLLARAVVDLDDDDEAAARRLAQLEVGRGAGR